MTKDPLARMLMSLIRPFRLSALFDRMERS
jgi:hypothetical protein